MNRKVDNNSSAEYNFSSGRTCKGPCGKWKSWHFFDPKPGGKNGFDSRCQVCRRNARQDRMKKKKLLSKNRGRALSIPDSFEVLEVFTEDSSVKMVNLESLLRTYIIDIVLEETEVAKKIQ